MIEHPQMGSQTLEILRQGVWASLTGGWFYDPHQDEFCNTFHLYLWLFLLCMPFTIYVYFPPTQNVWYFYCASVTIVFAAVKLVNYGLHHMYDTTECIREEVEEEWTEQKKEEEGIELQVLSNKTAAETSQPPGYVSLLPLNAFKENAPNLSTDADSLDSGEYEVISEVPEKTNSVIDLKAEVHRKNSSESSEEISVQPAVQIVAYHHKVPEKEKRLRSETRRKRRHSKADGFVAAVKNEPHASNFYQKRNINPQEEDLLRDHRPSLQSVELEHGASNLAPRRHSNFTNSSLCFIPTNNQAEIKPTGSLELDYIDKNLNQSLNYVGFFFKPNDNGQAGVRRIKSTALETTCPPPVLTIHPNSLEIIGGKGTKNPLPPPSTSLTRNQLLNLCPYPYYGSEIVYPIAEQSDEHQTSHGPDTDLDSLNRNSDSDYEENNQGSHSPLLFQLENLDVLRLPRAEKELLRIDERWPKKCYRNDDERTSATSKDALLDNDNSNSSATPEMQDARAEFYVGDDKKFCCECSNWSCSNTSVECEDVLDRDRARRGGNKARRRCENVDVAGDNLARRNARKFKKRKLCGTETSVEAGNCSSLVELDLDWLFVDENERLQHCKDSHKRDTEWSSTTTVSLEHDVSKVLQETVPSARSLGAIPKKLRPSTSHQSSSSGKTPRAVVKSESERCCTKTDDRPHHLDRNSHRNRSMKEYKLRQSLKQKEQSLEGLECLVAPSPPYLRKLNVSKNLQRPNARPNAEAYQEASSSGSFNEISALLPTQPLLQAFLASRRDYPLPLSVPGDGAKVDSPQHQGRLKRSSRIHRRPPSNIRRDMAISHTIAGGLGKRGARSFNDTTDGTVHCFVDEHGHWMTYTFDEKGLGMDNNDTKIASSIIRYKGEKAMSEVLRKGNVARSYRTNNNNKSANEIWDSNSAESICNSAVSIVFDVPSSTNPTTTSNTMIPVSTSNIHTLQEQARECRRIRTLPDPVRQRIMSEHRIETANLRDLAFINNFCASYDEVELPRNRFKFISPPDTLSNNFCKTKSYYKYKVFPWTYVKVTLDRLKLLALLDRNLTLTETILSVFLGVLVSVLGAVLLYLRFYEDLLAFIFCFIIASCQYSLLKSVQPDAASPTHGFNRLIAYSRPIYFCICSSIVILLDLQKHDKNGEYVVFSSWKITNLDIIVSVRDFLSKFILGFPLLFSLGLFPQINTFLMYFLEQIDMHVFGGNAMSSLLAAFYCVFRSVLAVTVLSGLVYGALIEAKTSQHVLFSIFCGCLVACCYHLSRSASDPTHVWNLLKRHLWPPDVYREHRKTPKKCVNDETPSQEKLNKSDAKKSGDDNNKVPPHTDADSANKEQELVDPLPEKLQQTVNARLKNDVILCGLIAILAFAIHASTVFTALQHELSPVLWCIAASLGFILHYVIPQLRKQLPWLCIARPVLRADEYNLHQVILPAKIMWFEKVYVYLCFLEKNILYPLLFLSALTEDSPVISKNFGPVTGAFIVVVCGLKCLRICYSDQSSQYLILTFTAMFHKYDYNFIDQTFLVEYFILSVVYYKIYELLLKVQFVVTYIAPWQITWGSAFHAFAQPFSVPHSAMLFLQALISAVLSTPLNPFLGSAIFLTSYVRPVKFWERDYNTRRVDHSNTPLSSHLDRNLGADDNNLNSIFYEHLTRSLQHSLCGDLILGRWGPVSQGDCFVLASDYLNCLVHIIELGNGLVTFQMRGLEFRGTYCQQREVEAITEGVEENDGCCCCDPGHLPGMLSINAAFSQRWLAWEVTAAKYILEGYSISDNNAVSMLQVFDFRKVLITYYVKSIIFYAIRSQKIEEWLNSQTILKALEPMQHKRFADLDPVFNYNIDEDFDFSVCGMTLNMFCQTYGDWISFCVEKSERNIETDSNSKLVLLCFALSLLGRRTLGAVSHNSVTNVEFFLYGLHALFKGDFRITCARDEWVFTDMDLLKCVVAPAVRMSLKLHQDHFMSPDEYEELSALYSAICKHEEELVISHEGDPVWRNAVLSGTPSLLALRHVLDDGTDEYKIIMLNKRYLTFRVIKINKECVRGLWAGQQQELVYLRNRNPERGSIQNAKQALRNIINSSCDQPIGYPIYVSPLTTSYAETNEQLCSLVGGSVSLSKIRMSFLNLFRRVRKRCGEGCSSGASTREEMGLGNEGVYAMTPMAVLGNHTAGSQSTEGSHLGGSIGRGSSLSRTSLGGNRGSLASMGKPTSSTLANLAGLFKERDERAISQMPDVQSKGDERTGEAVEQTEKEPTIQRVRIVDPNLVYDCINLGRRIDVCWPNDYIRTRGGRNYWRDWLPETGMEGQVVHRWSPCHKDPSRRSHVDRTILLVQIDDKYVPIAESGVQDLGAEV